MRDEERTLSAADVSAIVDEFEARIEARFFEGIGQGVWGVVRKGLAGIFLLIVGWEIHRNGGIG